MSDAVKPSAGAGPTGGGLGGAANRAGLPLIVDPAAVAPRDARELTKLFLARLRELEEGTVEYQYARNTLIELSLPLVHFAIRRFRRLESQQEDVVQVGTIGVIKAIDRFDLDRDVEFATFAVPYIVGEIKRFFRDATWAAHVPRRLQERRLVLLRAIDELETQLGRAPRVSEIAEAMQLTAAEVAEVQVAANAYSSHSLHVSVGEEGEANDTFADRIGSCDPELEKVENLQALKPLLAKLGERDRRILSMYFAQDLTQEEIGSQLGISQMHVSRLLGQCLSSLRKAMTT